MKKTKFQPLVVLVMVAVLVLTVLIARPSAQGSLVAGDTAFEVEGNAAQSLPAPVVEAGPTPMEANCASRLDGCLFRLDGHKLPLDMDGDGEWYRPGEPGLAGWKIRLDDGRVTTTDSEGYYAFEGLKERTYVVREVCPEGWVQTAPGFTDAAGCGSETHTAALSSKHPEVNDLDFGNGRPGLSLVKTCPADVFLGDEVEYAVTVSNTGNVALAGVRVEDALIGVNETVDLAPGESATFSGSYSTAGMQIVMAVARGQYNLFLPVVMRVAGVGTGTTTNVLVDGVLTNTATATAQYGNAEVTASESCTTKVHALDVSKDVQPAIARIYRWTIEKEVDDPGPHLVYVGDFIDAVYTVTVDLDDPAFLEDAHSVQGTIEVTNPAPMDAELASVSDVVSGGIVAAVDCPSLTVPAGGRWCVVTVRSTCRTVAIA